MKFTSRKLNLFTVFNLPAAYFTGVRTKSIDEIKNHPVWVDATNISKDEEIQLKDYLKLQPLTAEDLYNTFCFT